MPDNSLMLPGLEYTASKIPPTGNRMGEVLDKALAHDFVNNPPNFDDLFDALKKGGTLDYEGTPEEKDEDMRNAQAKMLERETKKEDDE